MAVMIRMFSKNRNFFINSNKDKLYTNLVTFDEIYNFVIQFFFSFEVILGLKQLIYCPYLDTENRDMDNISFFSLKMTSNE
jgi:hypothetical protein